MATYIVKPKQNIFDISLQLYGTIEGIFDLLITNTWLDMDTDLKTGQELEYHEDFVLNESVVSGLSEKNIVPSNGERHVYFKRPQEPLIIVCDVSKSNELSEFVVQGYGKMIVDWGDNSDLDYIQLNETKERHTHYFDNEVDSRRIKIYGSDVGLTYFDTSNIGGALKLTEPVAIEEYVSKGNGWSLAGLALFDGTYNLDFQQGSIADLSPIENIATLLRLDLRQVDFASNKVLIEYFQYIIDNYNERYACTIYMDEDMKDVVSHLCLQILEEEEWNMPTPWKFYFGDALLTK